MGAREMATADPDEDKIAAPHLVIADIGISMALGGVVGAAAPTQIGWLDAID
jgi:hypothetical protein